MMTNFPRQPQGLFKDPQWNTYASVNVFRRKMIVLACLASIYSFMAEELGVSRKLGQPFIQLQEKITVLS